MFCINICKPPLFLSMNLQNATATFIKSVKNFIIIAINEFVLNFCDRFST